MAGGFPLFTDNHVRQQIVEGLRRRGWDVVRAIDVFPEATDDAILFAYAAEHGRALVTCDQGIHAIAKRHLEKGLPFRMVFWRLERYREMSDGDFVRLRYRVLQTLDMTSPTQPLPRFRAGE